MEIAECRRKSVFAFSLRGELIKIANFNDHAFAIAIENLSPIIARLPESKTRVSVSRKRSLRSHICAVAVRAQLRFRETILGREGTQQCRVSINNGVCGDDRAAARMSRVTGMGEWWGARDATAATAAVAMQFPLVCRARSVFVHRCRVVLSSCALDSSFVRRSDLARARARAR